MTCSVCRPDDDEAVDDEAVDDEAVDDEAVDDEAVDDEAVDDEAVDDEAVDDEEVDDEVVDDEVVDVVDKGEGGPDDAGEIDRSSDDELFRHQESMERIWAQLRGVVVGPDDPSDKTNERIYWREPGVRERMGQIIKPMALIDHSASSDDDDRVPNVEHGEAQVHYSPVVNQQAYSQQNSLIQVPSLQQPPVMTLTWQHWFSQSTCPPINQDQIIQRSNVILQSNIHLKTFLRKIFPTGKVNGKVFAADGFIVYLEHTELPEKGAKISRGSWKNNCRHVYGMGLPELYSLYRNCSYQEAIIYLEKQSVAFLETKKKIRLVNKGYWVQECNPLRIVLEMEFRHPVLQNQCGFFIYRNSSGTPIGSVSYIKNYNCDVLREYRTLWRQGESGVAQVLSVYPEKPYMIYNADRIQRNPDSLVVFVENEMIADRNNSYSDVFSAVSGGLKNLVDADLIVLKGRCVRVVMEVSDLCYGKQIDEKLQKAEVFRSSFSLGLNDEAKSFDELEAVATKYNVNLLSGVTSTSTLLTVAPKLTLKVGDKFSDDVDDNRKLLLDPVIYEESLVHMYGPKGIGKSWIGLSIAYAIASKNGRFGKWSSPIAHSVFYIDGELGRGVAKERIMEIAKGVGDDTGVVPFNLLSAKGTGVHIDIKEKYWKDSIYSEVMKCGAKLLIIDTFLSVTGMDHNALRSIHPWLLEFIKSGVSVLIVDHMNRKNEIAGDMNKVRNAELLIELNYVDTNDHSKGFIVKPIGNNLHDEDAAPLHFKFPKKGDPFRLIDAQQSAVKGEGDVGLEIVSDEGLRCVADIRDKLEDVGELMFRDWYEADSENVSGQYGWRVKLETGGWEFRIHATGFENLHSGYGRSVAIKALTDLGILIPSKKNKGGKEFPYTSIKRNGSTHRLYCLRFPMADNA